MIINGKKLHESIYSSVLINLKHTEIMEIISFVFINLFIGLSNRIVK